MIPKQFCDGGMCGHGREAFVFILASGDKLSGFSVTPSQMKETAKMFNTQISLYEKSFGEIKTAPAPVISPIQFGGLGGLKDGDKIN